MEVLFYLILVVYNGSGCFSFGVTNVCECWWASLYCKKW